MPGEEAWLVGERRASGERKYYLSNLPPDANLKTLAAAIKARWVCEQAHQQLKEELGLDHFEGRSWRGLHRHALMTMIAYAYLQSRRLAEASGGKRIRHGPPKPTLPAIRRAVLAILSLARRPIDVPIAGETSQDASNKSAEVVLGVVNRSGSGASLNNRPGQGDLARTVISCGSPLLAGGDPDIVEVPSWFRKGNGEEPKSDPRWRASRLGKDSHTRWFSPRWPLLLATAAAACSRFGHDAQAQPGGKTFEALNQSWIKPLDDFDTTWLVAPRGAGDARGVVGKFIRNILS